MCRRNFFPNFLFILFIIGCTASPSSFVEKYLNACKINDEKIIFELSLENNFFYITDWKILRIEDIEQEKTNITEILNYFKQNKEFEEKIRDSEAQKENLINKIVAEEYFKLPQWKYWINRKHKVEVEILAQELKKADEDKKALIARHKSVPQSIVEEYNSYVRKYERANEEIKKYFITDPEFQRDVSSRDIVVKITDEIINVQKEKDALFDVFKSKNLLFNLWIEDKTKVNKLTNLDLEKTTLSGKYTLDMQDAYCQLSIQSKAGMILSKRYKIQLVKFDFGNNHSGWKVWQNIELAN